MSRIDPWRRDWLSPGGRGWACRVVRVTGFRFHDLRHYFASLLIADGLDVKTVQARLRACEREDHARRLRTHVAGQGRGVLCSGRSCYRCTLRGPGCHGRRTR